MKKFFIVLFVLIMATIMGGCLNLASIFPILNGAPVIISEPTITATENNQYSYQLEVNDPNGDSLTYFLVLSPEGMNINSKNGLISWTPTNNQVGIHQIIVEISDSKQSVTQSFEIEVSNVNNPPQIFSYSPANIDIKINEGNSVKFEVQAHDIDLNTTLSYQWLLSGKKVSSFTVSGDGSKSSWIYSASYGDYSQKIVKVSVSDGELEDYMQWNIAINDTSPPTQPTLNTITSPTNISPQILSGTKEANTSIWINGTEVVPLDSSNKWSYPFTLIEGENNISITSCDAVGNESAAVNNSITLDMISPTTPTLRDIISPTNICTQLLSGNKEINSSIWVNGVEVISVNSETTWSYDFELTEGENSISIISKDTVGNESNEINTTIILDTIAPAIPNLEAVSSPTNISSQTLSGTKEANSSILINDTEVVPLDSSTDWSYSYNLCEGTNNISITSRDSVGNESLLVITTIILDTDAPAAPTLDDVVSPTNISPQTLSGTKEPNTSVWINNIETIHINSSTNWTYDFNLSEGENNISITSQDSAGNESGEATVKIILDTISPTVPALNEVITPTNISPQILSGTKEANTSIWINGTEVVPLDSSNKWSYPFTLIEGENNISITSCDAVGNESAAVNNSITLDMISPTTPTLRDIISPTNICTQLLSGNKEINSSIWVNGVEVISVNSETTWSYDFELTEGENSISIISKDTVGNESNEINTTIILDTINPAIPTLDNVVSPTNISPQILSGNKETNSSIWINGTEVISINSDIAWSYTFDLFEGNNSISITSRDAAGNESSAITATIEYDPNIYVDVANISGIEDGTKTHPFNTITEGIEAVTSGKSVVVAAGTYNEQLIINKSIALQGASQDNTFIIGSGLTGNLITIEADCVTITGFTIDGASSTAKGIYFNSYSSININNNIIQNNISYGINYSNSSPTIENNNIKNNNYSGIDAGTGGTGIIRNNSLIFNQYGIRACGNSSPEIIQNNISNNSHTGIYCRESAAPIISYNTISSNSGYGILIDNILGNSVNPDIGGGDGQSNGQNKITGNYIHGVSNKSTHNIYAKYSWWGDTDGPKYPNNPDGNTDLLSDWAYWSETGGDIIFTPHLTAEP